jgi:hypothetical protein
LSQIRKTALRFGAGQNEQMHSLDREQRRPELPIAKVRSQQESSTIRIPRREEAFPLKRIFNEAVDGSTAFVAPKIGELLTEIAKETIASGLGFGPISHQNGKQVANDDFPAAAIERSVKARSRSCQFFGSIRSDALSQLCGGSPKISPI